MLLQLCFIPVWFRKCVMAYWLHVSYGDASSCNHLFHIACLTVDNLLQRGPASGSENTNRIFSQRRSARRRVPMN